MIGVFLRDWPWCALAGAGMAVAFVVGLHWPRPAPAIDDAQAADDEELRTAYRYGVRHGWQRAMARAELEQLAPEWRGPRAGDTLARYTAPNLPQLEQEEDRWTLAWLTFDLGGWFTADVARVDALIRDMAACHG